MVQTNPVLNTLITAEDIPYEEELTRQPYSVKAWLRYIEFKQGLLMKENVVTNYQTLKPLFILFERAVKALPGSYKIWKQYLDLRTFYVKKESMKESVEVEKMNFCFERALFLLSRMPRIWLDYLHFLLRQNKVSKIRQTFDRALRALPITQHSRIWSLYLKFAKKVGGETALRVYKRYIKLEIENIEDYIELLIQQKQYDEASYQLSKMIDLDLPSTYNKTPFQLWNELIELIINHPMEIKQLKVEKIIRSGINRFTDQVGKLWCGLAQYFILLNQLDKARDIFEEGIQKVITVRDFTQIFDAYAEFEESLLSNLMSNQNQLKISDLELDLRLLRFERLMDRRPILVNDVILRQNPNNVEEWIKRVHLFEGNEEKMIEIFTEAIKIIQPKKVTSKLLPTLWSLFSKFYEDRQDLETARIIFNKAVNVPFKTVDELATVWQAYAEFEIRNDNYTKALEVLSRATQPPIKYKGINFYDENLPVQERLFKSLKLWSFYVDLQESIGTKEATCEIYDQILNLKIATPQIIINYANYLEELSYFEESFRVYERGLELFNYPISFEIWNIYLTKFMQRYGGTKLERARDLFEQAIEHCPSKYAKPIYLLYGKLEEEYGLPKHAMRIYDRATRAIDKKDKFEIYQFYIAKATTIFGITATREIYERAIEELPDIQAKEMCIEFAAMERKLGEIDRARAIYAHASQFCDPKITKEFWQIWHDFEVQHGNEETFKEMLRIKRSVQAQFNTEVDHISAQILATKDNKRDLDEMNNKDSLPLPGFVKGKDGIKAYKVGEDGKKLFINESENNVKMDEENDNPDELEV